MKTLAVIIPAFKGTHLREALTSLAQQTCADFKLYVFDDASPEALAEIVQPYAARLDLVYHRFEENLGGSSLVAQWQRCIAATTEPYIWLFSDDDLALPEAVAGVYEALASNPTIGLIRLPVTPIDSAGIVIASPADPSGRETGEQVILDLLRGSARLWRGAEWVFSRENFAESGGLEDFPNAMFSDQAAWIKFSYRTGMMTCCRGGIAWRHHAQSLSNQRSERYRLTNIQAAMDFAAWVKTWSALVYPNLQTEISRLSRRKFFYDLTTFGLPCTWSDFRRIYAFSRRQWPHAPSRVLLESLLLRLSPWFRGSALHRLILRTRESNATVSC